MTVEIAGFLFLFVAALVLFSVEWFSPDVVALGLMLTLIVTGLLPTQDAFAGFGSETVLMILGLLILTESLIRTGITDLTGRLILGVVGNTPTRLRIVLLVAPSILSSFISNTAAVAFFMPITLGVAHRAKLSASRLLMPMAFAAIMAGSVTLIGTSTNLVVSGLMQQQNLEPLSMFELTPVGLPILIAGLLYMYFFGYRLIPDRTGTESDSFTMEERLYVSEIVILHGASVIGKSMEESMIMRELNLGVLRLEREGVLIKPLAETILLAGDVLSIEGKREDVLRVQSVPGIRIRTTLETLQTYVRVYESLTAEVIVLPDSPLIGRSIKGLQLRQRYNIDILAINQAGKIAYTRIGRRILRLGDVLLIQIPKENLHLVESERLFHILDMIDEPQYHPRRTPLSIIIFLGALLLAVFEVLPIAVAVLLGVLLAFVTRVITPEEAYRNIEWKTLILIGSMLAFGRAMQETGTAAFLADHITQLPGADSPFGLLTFFFALALILTQPMSNQAAAAILVPIAIQTAILQGFNPRPFAVMIALAASCSFITPLEPGCVIIYGAGKYKFMDFVRVGGLLTIVVYVIAIVLVPLIWHV